MFEQYLKLVALANNDFNTPNISQDLQSANVAIRAQQRQFDLHGKYVLESNTGQISSTGRPTIDKDISTIEEHIERLQGSINELLLEKKSSNDKASHYLSKRMYPVTSYYSELAGQLRKMIEDKTSQLVDLLLQKSVNSSHIDLHEVNTLIHDWYAFVVRRNCL